MTEKIQKLIELITEKLKENFNDRLKLIVLVGSQAREDANKESDVDLNVILDNVSTEDILLYKSIINETDTENHACGYLGSLSEIKIWPRYDLIAFFLGSKVLYGNIKEIVPEVNNQDIKENVLNTLSLINHSVRHSIIYDDTEIAAEMSYDLYKSAFFVLQYMYYLRTGDYIPKREDLKTKLSESDTVIIEMYDNWNLLKNELKNNSMDILNVIERWSTEKLKEIGEFSF